MNSLRTAVRQFSTMALTTTTCSPFTQAIVSSMRRLYPEALADKSFDNTGLLLEAPFEPTRRQKNSVLLAIDLTTAVADEAIKRQDSAVVAYHPIIFRGLKSITLDDTQQRSLLRLAQHGISVYSPHTAVDTVPGGMADWLCDVVTGSHQSSTAELKPSIKECSSKLYSAPTYPQPQSIPTTGSSSTSQQLPHTRSTIHPSPPASIPEGFESAGAGRLVTFNEAQPLTTLIDHIGRGVGLQAGIPIAIPQGRSIDDIRIRTVGMCPGSGSGVLLRGSDIPDLLFTGEMSHHEALAATERGSVVISLSHSNSERGYIRAVMQRKLQDELSQCWESDRQAALQAIKDTAKQGGATPSAVGEEVYEDASVEVSVSDADRDPYGIMIWRS
ncbi:Putative NGG1p interacting factor 3 [Penicillium brasilianum]|uniref:Putative NGG1p interacting factor 3 n=1 Tax=Penicillium brasilianum TaxID=104259 RepID=A0A0F7VGC3_PENBI|nr:Putative NGG1p interacting factor 3 [Penicillium brasilianum]